MKVNFLKLLPKMESPPDSFHLTLSSGGYCGSIFTNQSNFETQLYKTIHVQKELYEVGLLQVIYKPTKDIFNGRQHVHVFTLGENKIPFHIKIEETITRTVSQFNIAVASTTVEIITHFKNGKTFFKLKVPYKQNEIIRFEDETRKLLGFTNLEYPVEQKQTITAENEHSDETLKALQNSHAVFYIVRNPNLNKTIEVKQPYDVTGIKDLVTEINLSLMSENIEAEFHAESPKIVFESKNIKLHFQFSNEINRILGVGENYVITGEEAEFDSVDLYRGNQLMLIQTDLVEPQIWGSSCKPILKVIPQSRQGSALVNTYFNRVQYVGLGKSDIRSITIRATNESDEDIVLDKHQGLTCVLHVRLRYNV